MRRKGRKQSFGAYLRELRLTAKMSQSDLAGRLGICHTYVSHIEADDRVPGEPMLRRIAGALGLGADYFVMSAGRIPERLYGVALRLLRKEMSTAGRSGSLTTDKHR